MSTHAKRERLLLADLLEAEGPDAATLCEGWNTRDLAAHVVVRERRPDAAGGILIKQLAPRLERVMTEFTEKPYEELIQLIRTGPPRFSPFSLKQVEEMSNTVEFYVHTEDVRRAQPDWQPRSFDDRDQDRLWSRLVILAKGLARSSSVGVELVRTDAPAVRRIKSGEPTLVVRGVPTELTLFAYGRGAQADVDLEGDDAARTGFAHREFGI